MNFKDLVRKLVSANYPSLSAATRMIHFHGALQKISADQARSWFEANLHLFRIERATSPVSESPTAMTQDFFSIYKSVEIKGSWDRIDSDLLTVKTECPKKVAPVAESLNYYLVIRSIKRERLCTVVGDSLLCGEFNSVPSIWHVPLLFASMKAKRLLLEIPD